MKYFLLVAFLISNLSGCEEEVVPASSYSYADTTWVEPNILFILLDDFGYEIPSCNGGMSYETPSIDLLAANGLRCTNFRVCPNCSPSRVSLLTGDYSFKNYDAWGVMNWNNITIANRLKSNGYATAIFGKWQFDGGDAAIKHFGFDTYDVDNPYELHSDETFGSRYKNPTLYKDGGNVVYSNNEYLDDIITGDAINFMDSVSQRFFLYLSFSNTHAPFSPTPLDAEYLTWDVTDGDKKFFPSQVKYIDLLIGKVMASLPQNTIVVLCGDNGTSPNIYSIFNGVLIHGGKGTTTETGIHVPLIIYGKGVGVDTNFIDAPDIYTTLLDLTNTFNEKHDGVSIFSDSIREYSYGYWSPKVSPTSTKEAEWVLGDRYKVYATGKMYDRESDLYEATKLSDLTETQKLIRKKYLDIIASKH